MDRRKARKILASIVETYDLNGSRRYDAIAKAASVILKTKLTAPIENYYINMFFDINKAVNDSGRGLSVSDTSTHDWCYSGEFLGKMSLSTLRNLKDD